MRATIRTRACLAVTVFILLNVTAAVAAKPQQPTNEATMEVRLEIYRVADLLVTPIDFGTVLINGDGGSIIMDSSGALTFTGGILQTYDGPYGAARAGTLTMDANTGATANIAFDPTVSLGSGVVFTPALDSETVAMMGAPVTVTVYGQVDFPPDTGTGSYNGLLTIDVSYN